MSKYSKLYAIVGRPADWNDKVKNGRVLKWELDDALDTKKQRDALAADWANKFAAAGVPVQKVQVRSATMSRSWYDPAKGEHVTHTFPGYDKLSVYIDPV